MRINGHAHIFNLHTVLTRHAVKIMVDRVRDKLKVDFVADALERFLNDQVSTPEYLVEDELLARFLDYIGSTKSFKQFVKGIGNLPIEIRSLDGGLRELELSAMRATLDRISSWFDKGADSDSTIADIFETLRLAMKADVAGVANTILQDMRPDDGLVALMMDITSEQTHAADEKKFRAQLKGTADASTAFPGRVFPFVAVNTRRPSHFEFMREAIERHGFVGIKLYPSLGVPVDSPAMHLVYEYCSQNELPILLHCSLTGFYESEATKGFGNPDRWWSILSKWPDLYVCFAHTGGIQQNVLTPGGPSGADWPAQIEQLMLSYPNVYCDLAYHVDQMVSPTMEAHYLRWLRRLLSNPLIDERVMFGTDIWMVRLSMTDRHYWSWFEQNLTADEQKLVMEIAPAGFLGLPAGANPMRQNIARMVAFLEDQPGVGSEPAPWIGQVSANTWTILRTNPVWNRNNHAHNVTHGFLKAYMTAPQRNIPFEEAAALRLRQLSYWPNASKQDLDSVAQRFVRFCENSGGTFEGDYKTSTAIKKVAGLLGDGEKTLADAGATIDAIFRFSTELI